MVGPPGCGKTTLIKGVFVQNNILNDRKFFTLVANPEANEYVETMGVTPITLCQLNKLKEGMCLIVDDQLASSEISHPPTSEHLFEIVLDQLKNSKCDVIMAENQHIVYPSDHLCSTQITHFITFPRGEHICHLEGTSIDINEYTGIANNLAGDDSHPYMVVDKVHDKLFYALHGDLYEKTD